MTVVHDSISLGKWKRAIQLGGLRLIEAVYRPGRRLAPHAHDRANVSLVLGGAFAEEVSGMRVRATSTSFVVKPRQTVHANAYGDRSVHSFMIEIVPAREAELGFVAGMPAHWNSGGPDGTALLEVYRAFRSKAEDLESITLSALTQIVGQRDRRSMGQASPPKQLGVRAGATLVRAEALLETLPPGTLGSRELAARVGVHPVYLARLFRKVHACDISTFRRRQAVREAARRLADTQEDLSSIALATGFCDQSHLGRATQRELGMSPGAFRRLMASH